MPARATPRVIFEDTAGADENCDSVVQFFFWVRDDKGGL